jgi:hypothetical protein
MNGFSPFQHHTASYIGKMLLISACYLAFMQDKEASDSMSDAITLMGLSGLMRQAIKLIKGITLTQDDASFSMAVFSVLSWFKVRRLGNRDVVQAWTDTCCRVC